MKCNYVKVSTFLLLFCKFFQGIDKMFLISVARPEHWVYSFDAKFLCKNISLCFDFEAKNIRNFKAKSEHSVIL